MMIFDSFQKDLPSVLLDVYKYIIKIPLYKYEQCHIYDAHDSL